MVNVLAGERAVTAAGTFVVVSAVSHLETTRHEFIGKQHAIKVSLVPLE